MASKTPLQPVKVLKRHPFGGKYREVNDVYDCHPKLAKVLQYIGKVEFHVEPPKTVVAKVKAAVTGKTATPAVKKAVAANSTAAADKPRRRRGRPPKANVAVETSAPVVQSEKEDNSVTTVKPSEAETSVPEEKPEEKEKSTASETGDQAPPTGNPPYTRRDMTAD